MRMKLKKKRMMMMMIIWKMTMSNTVSEIAYLKKPLLFQTFVITFFFRLFFFGLILSSNFRSRYLSLSLFSQTDEGHTTSLAAFLLCNDYLGCILVVLFWIFLYQF